MKVSMLKIFAALFILATSFGCAEKIEHDVDLARKRAVEFAETVFVRRNLDKGYALLADKVRSYVPMEKFNEKLTKMHPNGHPSNVTAVRAEPVLGEKIIHVSLHGEGGGGQFEYGITVVGTATTDYRVTTFHGGRTS
jgi:hypothetical protein